MRGNGRLTVAARLALTAVLAILAVPRIALRSTPRAEIFTMVLLAAFLAALATLRNRTRPAVAFAAAYGGMGQSSPWLCCGIGDPGRIRDAGRVGNALV